MTNAVKSKLTIHFEEGVGYYEKIIREDRDKIIAYFSYNNSEVLELVVEGTHVLSNEAQMELCKCFMKYMREETAINSRD